MEVVKQKDNKSNGFTSITSRQCPAKLFDVVKTLSGAQKKDVTNMGFASILKLDILCNPLKLGYWVVDKLNTKMLSLEIDNKTSLQITRQSVQDIFGFPMGNIKVEDGTRADTRNNITREWRGQYPPAKKGGIQRVYLGHIMKQIKKERKEGTKRSFLPCLNNIEDISNMDWCGYLLKCLRNSKLNWKRDSDKSWYTGPLLFLILFYLDSTRSLAPNVEKLKPAIKFWNNEMLKNAEKEELDVGGFGTKVFSRPVEQIQNQGTQEYPYNAQFLQEYIYEIKAQKQLQKAAKLERDVIATINARNESKKRRMDDFEAPSFDLGFSPLKSQKHERNPNELEFIFETNEGLEVYRAIFESLIPKCEIHAGIIDLWSRKLNEEERHRNVNSTSRLFCHTGVLTTEMLNQPSGDFSMFHIFKQEMDIILKTTNESINEFDMVFFPIILHTHFFLLCFDLKHDCYDIINNSAAGDLFKYENVPIKLHPNASTMRRVWPRRLEMAWRTTNNNKDCGVFVMRHMETYDGTSIASWNPGLKPEGDGQDAQLDDLRKKYVTCLLVWKNNILKGKVLAEADFYVRLQPEKKTELDGYALERIEERFALWG
ncbi:ulp1 protease family, C-terminal catalytic domain-containing protein [Artemisia annua]|uniref:Ulp1 protease family, C-terminal catalytic domain-containing protein n=1 Tax=Artemisia annua TaxID=35608 RepID=A0A2U1N0A3_ARTAN|nr:ulp1 protease family, C-terminal catalytic domain-containing protein [Artemisia annua]